MRFDHTGYVVSDTDATAAAIKIFFPVIIRYKEQINAQQVLITLLATADGNNQVELVEPLKSNIHLQSMLKKSGKSSLPYHICFVVNNFDEQYQEMKSAGWIVLTRPFNAFKSDHRASHLYHPDAGIIEIMSGAL
ncbi:VOC family protein [Rahnella perminowiae]|uniref:VOC family protein n=1 Tax=Rahnella perminowiae TaxID=2816244 RepID=UPI00224AE2BF|nr:VOC family protein [Rahnella perminowiae]MCX2941974.1 VOC family protein [Rahnella perminowiae]